MMSLYQTLLLAMLLTPAALICCICMTRILGSQQSQDMHVFMVFSGLAVLPWLAPLFAALLPDTPTLAFISSLAANASAVGNPLANTQMQTAIGAFLPSGTQLVAALWLIGFLFFSYLLYREWRYFYRLSRLATPADHLSALLPEQQRHTQIAITTVPVQPFVIGFYNKTIILPQSLLAPEKYEQLALILQHECAHIARHDTLRLFLTRLLLAVNWFNPGLWWFAKQLQQTCEQATDERALAGASQAHRRIYANALLQSLKQHHQPTVLAAFGTTKRRLAMRLNNIVKPSPGNNRRQKMLGLLAAFLMLAPISWLHVAAANDEAEHSQQLVWTIVSIYKNNELISTPVVATHYDREAMIKQTDANRNLIYRMEITPEQLDGDAVLLNLDITFGEAEKTFSKQITTKLDETAYMHSYDQNGTHYKLEIWVSHQQPSGLPGK